jgi:ubiquinone/menaquinone biosynthesis C-methylase UbiE
MRRLYETHVLPRLIHLACRGREFGEVRRRYLAGLSGKVLEVGMGSGTSIPCYPPTLEKLLVVEPSHVARRLARSRMAEAPFPVEVVGLDGQSLPLPDASVDGAASTWTLCTIPDVVRALSEIRRVLKPGAPFHFVEHGRSPDAHIARWQDRLNPLQKVVAGGCHLNRPIERLLLEAGFEIERLDRFYMDTGPKVLTYLYAGVARSRSSAAGR